MSWSHARIVERTSINKLDIVENLKGRIFKKIRFSLVVVVVVVGVSYLYFSNDMFRMYLGYNPYTYKHFCYLNTDKCITVVTYHPFKLVDTTYKRYILAGKEEYTLPFKANYIEYPNDTNLFIEWKSNNNCEIISNLPPIKVMMLSDLMEVTPIYSNVLYETKASKNPEMSL